MSLQPVKVHENEPIVVEVTDVIGRSIPGAPYKEVRDAALSVVLHLRATGAIGRYEPPTQNADTVEERNPEKIPFWEVEGYAE